MNKKIRSYQELEQRKLELGILLKAQKELVKADLRMIQADLKGPRAILKTAGQFGTPKKTHPLLKAGIHQTVDLLFGKLLFGKASWLTRTLITYFARNYTTRLIEDKKPSLLRKLSSLLRFGSSRNGKAAPMAFGDLG